MKSVLLGLLSCLCFSCYDYERDCERFQTGVFEFETVLGSEVVKTTFERRESFEIETYQGKTDTSSIRWVSDCEYILKSINPKSMKDQKWMQFKILETDANTYKFEYNIVGDSNKQQGMARKIAD
ncbi:DNA topoisomerase IV [Psychroflexus maritimus]|uniref:DNA topoisomerase IV n=1 Tax=Psychroflexus maritimus TaxID=2714865 RepID=A0A967ADJ7_9FLAO|nr:DNA topoisomerase IV [Psychroflexus maritimus]NGZ89633.1 DNA topoisomerase IV [Psychroflexus maritimus]